MPSGPNGLLPTSEIERRTSLIGKYRGIVGVPKTDRMIADGHHPFHPDRAVILQNDRPHGFVDERLLPLCQKVRDEVADDFRRLNGRLAAEGLASNARACGIEKIALIVRIIDIVAGHYGCRDATKDWCRKRVWAESLGTTGFKNHINVLSFTPIDHTDNSEIDWWLFLLPGGMAFENLDGLPVHVLIGHAGGQSTNSGNDPSVFFDVVSPLVRQPPKFFTTWREFGQSQPAKATRALNEHFFSILEEMETRKCQLPGNHFVLPRSNVANG